MVPPSIRLQHLAVLLSLTGFSALMTEEQALLQFAGGLDNFDDVYSTNHWQGWGKDDNVLCPAAQVNTTDELLCFPDYPGEINATSQSWTGVVCTPNGTVLCLTLSSWGLQGSVGALEELGALQDMQFLNLANNSLSGSLPANLPQQFSNLSDVINLSVMYLLNNSISGTIPALWGDATSGWGQWLQALYLEDNQLTGKLPQVWSDSNSLINLFRFDLYGNKMTGSITWNSSNLPSLGNLVVLPGNDFCGTVPPDLEGVIRDLSASSGDEEVLSNVTTFGVACSNGETEAEHRSISHGAIAGAVLAAVAVALLAGALLIFCCRHRLFGPNAGKGQSGGLNNRAFWPFNMKRRGPAISGHQQQQPSINKLQTASSTASDINLLGSQGDSHTRPDFSSDVVSLDVSHI